MFNAFITRKVSEGVLRLKAPMWEYNNRIFGTSIRREPIPGTNRERVEFGMGDGVERYLLVSVLRSGQQDLYVLTPFGVEVVGDRILRGNVRMWVRLCTLKIPVSRGLALEVIVLAVNTGEGISYTFNGVVTLDSAATENVLTDTIMPLSSNCPRLQIYGVTDSVNGNNFAMAVLIASERTYVKYPCLTKVTAGKGCSLVTKLSNSLRDGSNIDDFLRYALLRYFLWYLIRGQWTACILKRRYTTKFFSRLSRSEYACWAEYFSNQGLLKYERYFAQ